jgi:hypothetical protein
MKKWWWRINFSLLMLLQMSCIDRGISSRQNSAGTPSEIQQQSASDSSNSTKKQIHNDRQKFEAPRHDDPKQRKIDSIKESGKDY